MSVFTSLSVTINIYKLSLKKLWYCAGGRVKHEKFGFIKRVNKGRISSVKDLKS